MWRFTKGRVIVAVVSTLALIFIFAAINTQTSIGRHGTPVWQFLVFLVLWNVIFIEWPSITDPEEEEW